MRDCVLTQDGDRLTIQPTLGMSCGPLLLCGMIGIALVAGAIEVAQQPPLAIRQLLSEPLPWVFVVVGLVLVGATLVWSHTIRYPIVLDKHLNEVEIGSRVTSLAGAAAVALRVVPTDDSDCYAIDIVFADRRLPLMRLGWSHETSRLCAEAHALRIADFLRLPLKHGTGA